MAEQDRSSVGARISIILAVIAGLIGVIPVTAETNSEKAAQSLAGSLDPTFDGDGLVTSPAGRAFSVAIQPDGKIVVAGQTTNADFLVARYNSDGSPDNSFDTDGMVTTDFGGADIAFGVAIQSDGKIVAAGSNDTRVAVARYNSNGSPDLTFDTDGKVVTDLGAGDEYISNVGIQADGKIVAIGAKNVGVGNDDIALVRYNSNGSLDMTFDKDGKVITPIGSGSDFLFSIGFQSDGKIVVGGGTSASLSVSDLVLVRYNSNGARDATFDNDGIVIVDIFEGDGGGHLALQPDGKILIAGQGNNSITIARYNAFGVLDPGFGTNGVVISPNNGSSFSVQDIALQQDNKIVLAGYANSDFALARFNSDGSPDAGFGSAGRLTTDMGGTEIGSSIAIQPDEKIVLAGRRDIAPNSVVAIARYMDIPVDAGIIYVDWDATGANDGTSWANAFTDLQAALFAADAGDEIWVAAGTYKPTASIARTVSFALKDGVALYGGFAGIETLLTQRNFQTNITILSGDIGIPGDIADNSYHVLTAVNINGSTLDGFTVTGGNADSAFSPSETHSMGGGVYVNNSNLNVSNMIFTDNYATFGGGIHNIQEEQFLSPTSLLLTNVKFTNNGAIEGGGLRSMWYTLAVLSNVVFDNNTVSRAGGGMLIFESRAVLTDVVFSNNSATPLGGGGGLLNWLGNPAFTTDLELTNVTFVNNSADFGGGMANAGGNSTLTNVTFSGNSANTYGGAISNEGGELLVGNATIGGNSAGTVGGGVYNDSTTAEIHNTILYDNTGGEIHNQTGTATVLHSIVEGGFPGTGNLDSNPLLGPLADNGGFTETMALQAGSPAVDTGDDANCPATDQRGVTRPQGGHCDIGAYEFEGAAPTPTFTPSPTNTSTSLPPTATHTPTRPPKGAPTFTPTRTNTPITPTVTPSHTPHPPTATQTFTPSPTSTATNVASVPADLVKSFSPLTIFTPGGTSRLSIMIFNPNSFQLTSASVVDNLPAGVTIANPINLSSSCGGTVGAVAGGTTLSLSGGSIPAQVGSTPGSCTVAIDVTSSTPGNHTNTIPAGALSTANGVTNVDPTSATLTALPSPATHTPTRTPKGGDTFTPSRTNTPITATPTHSATPQPPTVTFAPSSTFTATNTALPPTPTYTLTPSATATSGSSTFPSTGVLDNFNRANGGVGTNWSGFPSAFAVASNQLDVVASGVDTYIFWKNTSFGSNQEVHVTLTQIDTGSGNQYSLILKSQSNKSTISGLLAVKYDTVNHIVQIGTFHPTQGWATHGANLPVTLVNGDQFGARARADGTVEIYKNGVLIGTRSITSWPYYSSGGYIGLWAPNSPNAILDDFGGGTTTP